MLETSKARGNAQSKTVKDGKEVIECLRKFAPPSPLFLHVHTGAAVGGGGASEAVRVDGAVAVLGGVGVAAEARNVAVVVARCEPFSSSDCEWA